MDTDRAELGANVRNGQRSRDPRVKIGHGDEWGVTGALSILHSPCWVLTATHWPACLPFPLLFSSQDGGRPPPAGESCWDSHALHSGRLRTGRAERQVLYSHLRCVSPCLSVWSYYIQIHFISHLSLSLLLTRSPKRTLSVYFIWYSQRKHLFFLWRRNSVPSHEFFLQTLTALDSAHPSQVLNSLYWMTEL